MSTKFINLDGTLAQVTIRLVTTLESQEKLLDFVNILQQRRPDLPLTFASETETSTGELLDIGGDLQNVRYQLLKLQEESASTGTLENQFNEIIRITDHALIKSESLTARLILPSSDLTDVRLVPIHTLDRIEEYRADENIAFLLIGLFGGAVLGILSNWATSANFSISRFSIVLIALLILLSIASIIWASRINRRANKIKSKIFQVDSAGASGHNR